MRRKLSPSEIVARLQTVDGLVEDGWPLADALRIVGVAAETHVKWRSDYGGLLRLLGSPAPAASRGASARRSPRSA